MKNFKKTLNLTLLSIMVILIGFSSINYAMADDVQNVNDSSNQYNNIDYDSALYDNDGAVIDTDYDSDDFDYDEGESNSYSTFAENSDEVVSANNTLFNVIPKKDLEEFKPDKVIDMEAKKAYKVTGLKRRLNIQRSYVASGYIFVSQSNSKGTTFLSRCELKGTTATFKDEMKLVNFGHNQTLQFYSHNNKTYVLIGCKFNENNKKDTDKNDTDKNDTDKKDEDKPDDFGHGMTIQVGRIRYKAGTTISNYTQINRMVRLDCANTSGKPFDTITQGDKEISPNIKTAIRRMDASLSSNKKYLVLAVRGIHKNIQYSYYDFDVINNLLDKVDGKTPNYINCSDNTSIKNACKFSCIQERGKRILPNGSCQGIDFTNAYSIYMSSGSGTSGVKYDSNDKDHKNPFYFNYMPKIAKMVRSSNGYSYPLCIRINNIYTSDTVPNHTNLPNYYMEIEGIQNTADYLYFVLVPAKIPYEEESDNNPEKDTTQYIYSLSKQDIEEKIS